MLNPRLILIAFWLFISGHCIAQSGYPTENLSLGDDIESWYNAQRSREHSTLVLGAYNENARRATKSHPYFDSPTWIEGEIMYRGQVFENVSFIYNTNEDVLLIRHPKPFKYSNQPIELIQNQVDWFKINGKTFKYYEGTDPQGFMQVLHEGKVSLLSKRAKITFINSDNVSEYKTEDRYYLYVNGKMSRVFDRYTFWRSFKEHKSEIKNFIKQNDIPRMKKATDEQLAAIAAYCDEIISKSGTNE